MHELGAPNANRSQMSSGPENPNPIVAMAMRIRARKDVEVAIDAATPAGERSSAMDAAASLGAFGDALQLGAKRLNSIMGVGAMQYVRLEKPLRVRLRFGEKRVSLSIDEARQLVIVKGLELDGEYQFDTSASVPALVNLSKLSTEAGYHDELTPNVLLKAIAKDAELPRPDHLDSLGPLQL
jgi:hypothetical protein